MEIQTAKNSKRQTWKIVGWRIYAIKYQIITNLQLLKQEQNKQTKQSGIGKRTEKWMNEGTESPNGLIHTQQPFLK